MYNIKDSENPENFAFKLLLLSFLAQNSGFFFADSGGCNVVSGDLVAVRAFKASLVSTVKRDEAGSWNPVIVELFLCIWGMSTVRRREVHIVEVTEKQL